MKSEYTWEQLDFLRRTTTVQEAEIKQLRRQLAVERFRRLTLEIEKAVAANDEAAWRKATTERMALGVTHEEAA